MSSSQPQEKPEWKVNLEARARAAYEASQAQRASRLSTASSKGPFDICCGNPAACTPADGRCPRRDKYLEERTKGLSEIKARAAEARDYADRTRQPMRQREGFSRDR